MTASFSTMSNYDSSTQLLTVDITVTWTEPMYPNGVIQTYKVTVNQTDDSSFVYSSNTQTDTTVTASVMVLPFTNYTVTVVASTSAGQGEGETVTLTAPQAGIYVCVQILPCSKQRAPVNCSYMCTITHTHAVHSLFTSLPPSISVAPSAPREVTAEPLTSESIRVSWMVPKPANGDIIRYIITYIVTGYTW